MAKIVQLIKGIRIYGGSNVTPPDPTPLEAGTVFPYSHSFDTITVRYSGSLFGVQPYQNRFQIAPDVAGNPGTFLTFDTQAGPGELFGIATGLNTDTDYWFRMLISDHTGQFRQSNRIKVRTITGSPIGQVDLMDQLSGLNGATFWTPPFADMNLFSQSYPELIQTTSIYGTSTLTKYFRGTWLSSNTGDITDIQMTSVNGWFQHIIALVQLGYPLFYIVVEADTYPNVDPGDIRNTDFTFYHRDNTGSFVPGLSGNIIQKPTDP